MKIKSRKFLFVLATNMNSLHAVEPLSLYGHVQNCFRESVTQTARWASRQNDAIDMQNYGMQYFWW